LPSSSKRTSVGGTSRVPSRGEEISSLEGPLLALYNRLFDHLLALPELAELTFAHLRFLYWVGEHHPVPWQEAGRKFGYSSIRTTRLSKDLVRWGLLKRCGDLFDPGVVYLHLSIAGRSLLSRIEAQHHRFCRNLLGQLSHEEQAALTHCLHLLLTLEEGQNTSGSE
jgi:DNA-binding MarR family transcriptional regulator